MSNIDPSELDKFSRAAHRWWDTGSEFEPLHRIDPFRVEWIGRHLEINGTTFLDVGCGGGILSESLARRGAKVLGIDVSEKVLGVARLHGIESGLKVDYRAVPVENLAAEESEAFDAVACMEMLEHVPDPESVVSACAKLVKPGGHLFFSTIDRNLTAYLFAIVGAERILGILPPGTHDFARFIRPSELIRMARESRLETDDIAGFVYNPVTRRCQASARVRLNYLLHARRRP
ncbi:MAG: bifunctional 2-polyprenyl-6-hydroxyphenol methylase/3-demethylubiquinol 3-O-methyltransferase UbiG [Candidatus Accumulibacter sp.]|jgi:2-polyprenyl-6-hydroxyphenyl methylase/3-demethylubiquinone-9 3-methyltransferase|nr:bifunctional 2-polyprenyl-6-hydroxyphenol methylase/3-demethylubiquinol 3-O-methyltransferase UbiG [Accumulibacter sp.]